MRKRLRPILPAVVLLLACGAARAQMRQAIAENSACAAAWERFAPEIRSRFLVTPRQAEKSYEAAKELLRACEGVDTAEVRFVKGWLERYEAAARTFEAETTFWELAAEVRKGGAPAATYARLAEAGVVGLYEPNLRQLHMLLDSGKSLDSKEVRDAWSRITEALDTIVAAYARAIALCGSREGCQVAKGSWTGNIWKYYALRHDGSTEGLQETVARGLDAPIPFPEKR